MVMKMILEPGISGNFLSTIAIGGAYYDLWEKKALPSWLLYCRRHDLGLIVFNQDLIDEGEASWKKATWQKMLIGEHLLQAGIRVKNICYLDTDILINPTSPNIFDGYDETSIGLTSIRKNLPYPYDEVLRRLAFLRHTFYDSEYPLDSALFMSLEQLYGFHGMETQPDEACMGLIVFNAANHSRLMRGWFDKYDRSVKSVTNGGDQTHINYEIQRSCKVSWLDYRFQAIWVFEMAWKYPFLYEARDSQQLIDACIEASMYGNYFLHFAGAWHESDMWKSANCLIDAERLCLLEKYETYRNSPVKGVARGFIKPK